MTLVENAPRISSPKSVLANRDTSAAPVEQHIARRALVAAGLCTVALLHVMDLQGKLQELPYVGWMYLGLIVSALVIAEGLLRDDSRILWLAAGALAASAFVGYSISRTTGLPGDMGSDKGNWTEPLGLAALVVESIIVLLVVGRLITRRR